jgi:serine protease AprX
VRLRRKLLVFATVVSVALGVAAVGANADGSCSLTPVPFDPTSQIANNPHSLYNAILDTGAQTYYQNGYYGQGVDVAVVDTGAVPVQGLDQGNLVQGPDLSFESNNPSLAHLDGFNHGTHMAGIIAGRDPGWSATSYLDPSKFQGVAPLSRVVSVKVGDSTGAVDVSQIIAGIDWAVTHRHDNGLNIRVISLSLGLHVLVPAQTDALEFAAQQAWKNGVVVVAAAGNDGPLDPSGQATSLLSPAYGGIIAVGSYDPQTLQPSTFSQSRSGSDGVIAFAAPGQSINSLHVTGSYADTEIMQDCQAANAAGRPWTNPIFGPNGRFIKGSGTSQATAIAAGAAALMISKNPKLTPDQIQLDLMITASQLRGNSSQLGEGGLNLTSAYSFNTSYSRSHANYVGGLGLDADRPDMKLLSRNGVPLIGDQDWMGSKFLPAGITNSVQNDEPKGSAWKVVRDSKGNVLGESWNGNLLTGSGFVYDGTLGTYDWQGHTWSGTDWAGELWSGHTWSGHTWSGNRWSGADWDSDSFTGHTWSGHTWGDFSWS